MHCIRSNTYTFGGVYYNYFNCVWTILFRTRSQCIAIGLRMNVRISFRPPICHMLSNFGSLFCHILYHCPLTPYSTVHTTYISYICSSIVLTDVRSLVFCLHSIKYLNTIQSVAHMFVDGVSYIRMLCHAMPHHIVSYSTIFYIANVKWSVRQFIDPLSNWKNYFIDINYYQCVRTDTMTIQT